MTKRLLTLATAGALVGLVGCSTPMNTPDGSTPTDGGTTPDSSSGTGQTYTYVINALTVEPTPPDENAALSGFNLDNRYSVNGIDGVMDTPNSCLHQDNPSNNDRDQNCPAAMWNQADGRCMSATASCAPGAGCRGGVDNQLPTILDAIETAAMSSFPMGIRPVLTEQVNTHRISLVMRVTGVNSLTDDDSVTIKFYNAYPTFSTGCDSVAGGREYAVSTASLNTATDIETAKISFAGKIVGGRLIVTAPGMFPLPLPEIMGAQVNLTLTNAQLRVNLTEAGGSNGNLGGSFNGGQLLTTIMQLAPDFATQGASLIGGFVDIEEGGICANRNAMPPQFGGIGVGLGFTLVPATVAATPIADRAAGTCGASSSSSDGGTNG